MATIVEAPPSNPSEGALREQAAREQAAPPAVIVLPLVPAFADKEQCMFPNACKWPTCSC